MWIGSNEFELVQNYFADPYFLSETQFPKYRSTNFCLGFFAEMHLPMCSEVNQVPL